MPPNRLNTRVPSPMPKTAKKPANPRRKPSQSRSGQTVEFILEATAHILIHEGYSKASTNRIAEKAGVSIGSLYQYFPNKQALLETLCQRHINQMIELLARQLQNTLGKPLEDAIPEIVKAMLEAHALEPELHRVFLEQAPFFIASDSARALEERTLTVVKLYLEHHKDEIQCDDLEMAAFIIVQTVESLTHRAVLHQQAMLNNPLFVEEVSRMLMAYLKGR